MRSLKHLVIAVVLLVAFLPGVARAVEVAGVRFPDRIRLDGAPLALNGVGVRRATIF